MSSIASAGDDLVPSGHRIDCSRNRMDGFAWCFEMDFAVHGPSIGQCCQLSGEPRLRLLLFFSSLDKWEALLPS